MRQIRVCLSAAVTSVVMLLPGCGFLNTYQENVRLRERLEKQEYLIELAEREASITRGCEYIFNICPDPMLNIGRAAIKDGFSGGTSSIWFFFVALKLTLLAVAPALFISIVMRTRASISSAKEKEALDCEEQIESTRARIRQMEESASKRSLHLTDEAKQLETTCHRLKNQAQELASNIEYLESERDSLKSQIENIRSVRQALDAFK
jgi:DNA repair exonuclease SbcCD ATPase subunit